ncbi:MAG: ComEC/Rec2 family competence protein [Ignavibacteriaceae bacterium]|nr:ComEC/Rec2 family competence protein [Ignavibacteriaceae bacterium]
MKHYPFIKYSIAFILGILGAFLFSLSLKLSLTFLSLLVVTLFINKYFIKPVLSKKLFPPLLFLAFLSLGSSIFIIQKLDRTYMPVEIKNDQKMIVYGSVRTIDLIKENELTFTIKADSVRAEKQSKCIKLELICRVRDKQNNLLKLYNKLLPGYDVRVDGIFRFGRIRKNPGEFDYNNYLAAKGIAGILIVNDAYEVKRISLEHNVLTSTIFLIRKYIDHEITSFHDKQTAALLRGLILADRSQIDEDIKTDFMNTGVTHILSVSGLHVGYIFIIFTILFGRFDIILRNILTLIGLILFMCLTGFFSSVFRAVVMAAVVILSQISNRSTNIYNSLSIAAFIVLFVNPSELFDAGFQLSFLAVFSIAVIYPIIENLIIGLNIKSKIVKYILLFLGVSLSAQLGTLPLTFLYFGKLSLVSLFTNLFVIPISGLIVGVGIFTTSISYVFPFITGYFAEANNMLTFIMYKFISTASSLHFSFLPIRNFSIFDTLIFYLGFALILIGVNRISTIRGKIVYLCLIIFNIITYIQIDNNNYFENEKLNLLAISTSGGNSTLLQFPNRQTVLINGGTASFYYDNGDKVIIPLLNLLGVDTLNYAFISSCSNFNYGGFISLIKKGKIKNVFKPVTNTSNLVDTEIEKLITNNKIQLSYFTTKELKFGNARIYPITAESNEELNKENKHNINTIFKIMYGNSGILWLESAVLEKDFVNSLEHELLLNSEVLIISNVKDNSQNINEIIKRLKPKMCLISFTNRNKFTKEYRVDLNGIRNLGCEVHLIQEDGAIVLQSDGEDIKKVDWNNKL